MRACCCTRRDLAKSNEYYRKLHPDDAKDSDAVLAAEKAKAEAKAKAAAEAKAKAAARGRRRRQQPRARGCQASASRNNTALGRQPSAAASLAAPIAPALAAYPTNRGKSTRLETCSINSIKFL